MRPFESLFAAPITSGLTKPKQMRGVGAKFLNMGELFAYGRLDNVPMERAPITEPEAEKYLLAPGDLLFGRRSLTLDGAGKCSVFLGDIEPVTFEGSIIRVRLDKAVADPLFYYYYFKSPVGRARIETIVEQTAVAGIRSSDLRRLEVLYLPLAQQSAIADFLGTLDEKIELNRKMSATLEAMAWALFKSWFVDFDPVRAKSDGRDTGLPGEIGALFPDSFEQSDLGEIPKGWRAGLLGDLLSLEYGKALKAERRSGGRVPVYGSNGVVGWHNEALVKGPGIVVGRKGNPGTVNWSQADFFPIDTTFYVAAKPGSSLLFVFHALCAHDLPHLSADSAVPGLNRNHAYMSRQLMPPGEVVANFEELVGPLSARSFLNGEESKTLASLRDALLPKLMSGEIRVGEAKRIVGKSA